MLPLPLAHDLTQRSLLYLPLVLPLLRTTDVQRFLHHLALCQPTLHLSPSVAGAESRAPCTAKLLQLINPARQSANGGAASCESIPPPEAQQAAERVTCALALLPLLYGADAPKLAIEDAGASSRSGPRPLARLPRGDERMRARTCWECRGAVLRGTRTSLHVPLSASRVPHTSLVRAPADLMLAAHSTETLARFYLLGSHDAPPVQRERRALLFLDCLRAWSERFDADHVAAHAPTWAHSVRRCLRLAPPLLAASDLPPRLVEQLWAEMARLGSWVD